MHPYIEQLDIYSTLQLVYKNRFKHYENHNKYTIYRKIRKLIT